MRATRFPLHLVARYREVGGFDWRVVRTENISRSGVLVRTADHVEVDARLELRVELPPFASGDDSGEIWCRGRVVRTAPQSTGAEDGYAVAIEQYNLLPPSARCLTQ